MTTVRERMAPHGDVGGGRLTPARVSPPTRRSLLKGLLAYRWLTIGWATSVFTWEVVWRRMSLDVDDVARPGIGFALAAAAIGLTTVLTLLYRRDPDDLLRPLPVLAEIAIGTVMLLADTWVFGSHEHPQTLPSIWVVGAVASVALSGGRPAAVVTGVGMGLARYVGLVLVADTEASLFRGVSTMVLLGVSGWVIGYLLQRLAETDRVISAYRAREEVARTLHDGVLQTLAVIPAQQRRRSAHRAGPPPGARAPGLSLRRPIKPRRPRVGPAGAAARGGGGPVRCAGGGDRRPRPPHRRPRRDRAPERRGRRSPHERSEARRGDDGDGLCGTDR